MLFGGVMSKKMIIAVFLCGLCVGISTSAFATMLSWTASKGDVDGYKIYWSKEDGVYTEANSVDVGNVTQYSLCLLPINQNETYYFAVKTYGTEWGSSSRECGFIRFV